MRIRWRGLELPTRVVNDQEVSTPRYGKFSAEPFERGFGTTVGNSLRRILLSSLEGAAVTSVRISGVNHEFTSVKGVFEDVVDIVLNIKNLVLKSYSDEPQIIRVASNVKGPVTAGMIDAGSSVEIADEDHLLLTLTDNVPFEMEMEVRRGRGYVPAEEVDEHAPARPAGFINVDAFFSPVTRVRYSTENTRVGQKTNYDRMVMEVWTDGTITPEMALAEAAKILRKHLNPFVQYFELGEQLVSTGTTEARPEVDDELQQKLRMSVQEMELSVRAHNCLESAKIQTVGQLVNMPESDLLKIRSFGKTSLKEVKRKLADMNMSLGMNVQVIEVDEDYPVEDNQLG